MKNRLFTIETSKQCRFWGSMVYIYTYIYNFFFAKKSRPALQGGVPKTDRYKWIKVMRAPFSVGVKLLYIPVETYVF